MATIDFSSGYRDATKGATLRALQKRRDEQAAATALAMKPREIGSMWQGAAQIGDVISGSIREGRLANQEAAGRARFAQLLAGGLAPDEIGEAMGLDPETAMKYQERTWAQEDTEKKHGWDVDAAAQRVRDEQTAAKLLADAAVANREDTQTEARTATETAATTAAGVATTANDRKVEADRLANEQKVKAAEQAATVAADQARTTAGMEDPIAKVKLAVEQKLLTPEEGQVRIEAINRETANKNTPAGLDQLNRDFAKEANEWQTVGQSTMASNQTNVAEAIKVLQSPGVLGETATGVLDQIGMGKTGGVTGLLPEAAQNIINPAGIKARDSIRTAVQSSLKHVLGTQFAAVEGEQMMNRAFNMSASPQENARRAQLIMAQLQQSAQAKDEMVKYYIANNYSLKGYTGTSYEQIQEDFRKRVDEIINSGGGDDTAAPQAEPEISDEDLLKKYGGG